MLTSDQAIAINQDLGSDIAAQERDLATYKAQFEQLIGGMAVNPSTILRNPDDEVYCPPSEERPTPAVSEQE